MRQNEGFKRRMHLELEQVWDDDDNRNFCSGYAYMTLADKDRCGDIILSEEFEDHLAVVLLPRSSIELLTYAKKTEPNKDEYEVDISVVANVMRWIDQNDFDERYPAHYPAYI